MKKGISKFSILILFAIIIFSVKTALASSSEVKDRFEKTYKVSEADRFILNMYDSDLQINTWSNNEIKLTGEILISGGEKDDIEKLLNAFKNPIVNQGAGRIDINTSFIESSSTFSIFGFNKNRTKLSTGETISFSTCKANYIVWIPEKMAIELSSKYNKVKASNLLGKLEFEMYNVDLEMGDFGDNSTFDLKYSTANIGSGSNVRFNIYDCKLYTQDLNKVIINSKYSNITSKTINLLAAESYTDKFTIDNLNGIDFNAKYSTLNARGKSNIGKFNLYDCNIDVEDFTRIEYDSKYSEFTANKVGAFSIKESYTDTYKLNEVNDFSCKDSKYNKVRIAKVLSSIYLPSSYDTNFRVDLLSSNFTSFKGDFKYGSVTLIADPTLDYRLICENSYGEVNYPKERFKNKPLIYIEKDSKTKLECSTAPNAKCEIKFTSYDMNFTIE